MLELLLSDRLLGLGTEGNLEAEGAVCLVGSSVAWVKAVGFLALRLGWVASQIGVEGIHFGGSYLHSSSLGVVDLRVVYSVRF